MARNSPLGRLDGSLGFYDTATGQAAAGPEARRCPRTPLPPALPEITRLEPRGVQSGATTKVKVTGKNLAGLKAVNFNAPGTRRNGYLDRPIGHQRRNLHHRRREGAPRFSSS